ncbi:membrane protein containing RDD domain [Sulfurimonas gotlandica GD1]|uniref:Membrane protein containing RDD domain n=1 Tax=Sulfurimonas gotlandica (strain DSM 19862 / JCM 16533 / GD1) TaxID=929558 RepID=B6BNP3_SULGG|nr:RDD family protein [Sulfurimonas gotlandica]EDZ61242.1 RDD protein [Sulfurimonas gotlandica GD1]EHP28846.1 membrane protein containing RDD domain [Sulfurimonas gotlandica GD1]
MNEVRYAGFWIRFVASFLDTLFLALPVAIVIYFLSDGNWFDFSQYQQNIAYAMSGNANKALSSQPQMSMKWELLFEAAVLIVTMVFWRRWRGATPGKKFVHIKIVDAITLQDIDNKQAITRSIGYIVSTLALMIGFLMVAFRADKRGLHDLLAGTVVIYDEELIES